MESIDQPFDGISHMGRDPMETRDRVELIDSDVQERPRDKSYSNGDSPRAESSPLHSGKSTNSLLHGPQNQGLRIIIISSIVFAVAVTVALILTIYLEPKEVHGHAAVATEDGRCSEIGLQLLRDGGNAVDAAVGAAFCLGVVNPAHSGLGGGGFALVHDHKFISTLAYDFREVAPLGLRQNTLSKFDEMAINSTGVPGMLKGLYAMHSAHGVLPWKDVVYPSIDLADSYFPVSENLAKIIFPKLNPTTMLGTPLGQLLLQPNGLFKTTSDNMTFPAYADTLRTVAEDPDALYTGSLMTLFVQEINKLGGLIVEEDMTTYKVNTPKVLTSTFKGQTVVGMPPPSSGAVVAMILNIVDKLGWDDKMKNDPQMYVQLVEAFRYGFGHRQVLGDPDPQFHAAMDKNVEEMISPELAKAIAKEIQNTTHTYDPEHYGPTGPVPDKGTSHISVIDSAELMVSMTLSLNSNFGNQYMLSSGIILNNELMDFDLTPGSQSANIPEAGKRPLSSMSPTILYNQEHPCSHRVVLGAANGTRIITGVSETLINSVVFNMNISAAVKAPRVHNQLGPDTEYEKGIPADAVAALSKMGLNPVEASQGLSIVEALEKTNDELGTASDSRNFGQSARF